MIYLISFVKVYLLISICFGIGLTNFILPISEYFKKDIRMWVIVCIVNVIIWPVHLVKIIKLCRESSKLAKELRKEYE